MSQMDRPTSAQTAKAARKTTSTPVSVMTGHLPTVSEGTLPGVRETDPPTFSCRRRFREGPRSQVDRANLGTLLVSGTVSGFA